MGLLRDIHRSKDYFFHKLTSSRFTHVFYYKREKKHVPFLLQRSLSHFSSNRTPLYPIMVYLHRLLIVLFILLSSFPF